MKTHILTTALVLGILNSAVADDESAKKSKRQRAKHNPSGTWVWESDVGGEYVESQLKFSLRGKKLTGEYSDQNVSLELENPQFDGKTVTFTLDFDVDGTQVSASFSGVAEADMLVGTTQLTIDGADMEMKVNAKRRTSRRDVVGKWQFKVETGEGEVFEPVITLSLDKGALVGTYEGSVAGKHELQDVQLKDNVLSFTISGSAETDGSSFTAKFSGTPRGNRMRGKSEVDINGAQTTAKVRGRRMPGKDRKRDKPAA